MPDLPGNAKRMFTEKVIFQPVLRNKLSILRQYKKTIYGKSTDCKKDWSSKTQRTVKSSVLQEHRIQNMRQWIELKVNFLENFDFFLIDNTRDSSSNSYDKENFKGTNQWALELITLGNEGKAEVKNDTSLSCKDLKSIVMSLTKTGNKSKDLILRKWSLFWTFQVWIS